MKRVLELGLNHINIIKSVRNKILATIHHKNEFKFTTLSQTRILDEIIRNYTLQTLICFKSFSSRPITSLIQTLCEIIHEISIVMLSSSLKCVGEEMRGNGEGMHLISSFLHHIFDHKAFKF